MEKFILFPKKEINLFYEAIRQYQTANYQTAVSMFEKAKNLNYFKKDCIKYLIDCHIELRNFDEVYKMIEDEFVEKNIDEEYLLKKYLYSMVLDEQYIEANEIIKIYQNNKTISKDLKRYFDDLLQLIDNNLKEKNNNNIEEIRNYLLSSNFEDHIQIILNIDKINYNKLKSEINSFLNNKEIDSFVKYNLLKYLLENTDINSIEYTNFYNKLFVITKTNFINLLEDKRYLEPIKIVSTVLENKYNSALQFINNIWLDYSIKSYPDFIDNIDLSSALLNVLIFQSLGLTYNVNDVCKTYNVNSKDLFNYFIC